MTLEGEFAHQRAENIPDGLSLYSHALLYFLKYISFLKQPDNIKSITFSLEACSIRNNAINGNTPDGSRHGKLKATITNAKSTPTTK